MLRRCDSPSWASATLAWAVLALAACDSADSGESASDPTDGQPEGGKADGLGDEVYATRNEQVRLLRGFHPLIDRADSTCVERMGGGPGLRVGSDRESYRMQLVQDRETLARALGIDLGLKVKYLGRSGGGELSFLDELELNKDSLTLLITAEYTYAVSIAQDVDLDDDARALLDNDEDRADWSPAWFANRCGTGYVTGIRYGSSYSALITIETMGEKHARSVAGKLGFNGGIGLVELSADAASNFSKTITDQNLTASVDYLGEGFRIPGGDQHDGVPRSMAAEFGSESVERFVTSVDALRENVRRSKEFDRCLDVGHGICRFTPVIPNPDGGFVEDRNKTTVREAPGYQQNVDRAATVREVGLGTYRNLPSTSPSAYDALDQVSEGVLRARAYLTDYAELDERMTAVHQRELQAFVGDKSAFNVASPGEPLRDIQSLQGLHDRWDREFAPRTASGIGDLMDVVEQRQRACWESAKRNTFEDCAQPVSACEPVEGGCGFVTMPGEDTCTWCSVDAALARYAQSERLSPVRYQISEAVSFDERYRACRAFDTDYERYRLAVPDEVRRLAAAISQGPIDWDLDGEAHEVWYDAGAGACAGALRPVYRNEPGADAEVFECASEPSGLFAYLARSSLCVPSDGPMPILPLP